MSKKGFTLVELMIVIAIIAIIAAVAIPSLIRSKISANESSAISTLRTIASAEIAFSSSREADVAPANGQGEFTASLVDLQQPPSGGPGFLGDETLATSGQKAGYTFAVVTPGTNPLGNSIETTFDITAVPTSQNVTGIQNYFTDETVVIRSNTGAPANRGSLPIS